MKVFTDPSFSEACGDTIAYGFYTRQGGVSQGIYASLNCSPGSNDDADAIAENRSRVATHLGYADHLISTPWQCHSAECLVIDTPLTQRPEADAIVTDKPNIPIGILTADCGPVLMVGKKQNGAPVIAACHAGWGGALKGILESTIDKMLETGATLDSIKSCLGPCLMQASYEVSDDFMRPFIQKHEEAEHFFKAGHKSGHQMFDLPGYIAMRLSLAGIKHVSIMGIDTYKKEKDLFSFRRATPRDEADYGRQMSTIVIRQS